MQVQAAVKKETGRIAGGTIAGGCIMLLVFFILHQVKPDVVPFDYRVILGAVLGCAVAVGNFFFMGITVQKVASTTDEKEAYRYMRVSYRYRTLSQLVWAVLALVLPVFNGAAGIIPLFLPSMVIKFLNLGGMINAKP